MRRKINEWVALFIKMCIEVTTKPVVSWMIGVLFMYVIGFWLVRLVSLPFTWAYNLFF